MYDSLREMLTSLKETSRQIENYRDSLFDEDRADAMYQMNEIIDKLAHMDVDSLMKSALAPMDVKVMIENGVVEQVLTNNSSVPLKVEVVDVDTDLVIADKLAAYRDSIYADPSFKACDYSVTDFDEPTAEKELEDTAASPDKETMGPYKESEADYDAAHVLGSTFQVDGQSFTRVDVWNKGSVWFTIGQDQNTPNHYISSSSASVNLYFDHRPSREEIECAFTDRKPNRFVRIDGREYSFAEIAQRLHPDDPSITSNPEIQLCQRVKDGILVSHCSYTEHDNFPFMDVELELPEEKESLPVLISHTEQPDESVDDPHLRTFCYDRTDEYFMSFDTDTRSDAEVDKTPSQTSLVVSGNPWNEIKVFTENQYVSFEGLLPSTTKLPSFSSILSDAEARAKESQSAKEDPQRYISYDNQL